MFLGLAWYWWLVIVAVLIISIQHGKWGDDE